MLSATPAIALAFLFALSDQRGGSLGISSARALPTQRTLPNGARSELARPRLPIVPVLLCDWALEAKSLQQTPPAPESTDGFQTRQPLLPSDRSASASDKPAESAATRERSAAPVSPLDRLASPVAIHRLAQERFATVEDYICRLRRKEAIGTRQLPEDLLLLRYRKRPRSLHMKWLGDSPFRGREVVYVEGSNPPFVHVRTSGGDGLAGLQVKLSLDSPRLTKNTRWRLDQAGLDKLVELFGAVVTDQQAGSCRLGTLRLIGYETRSEYPFPLVCVEQKIPPGAEKFLPDGGVRKWYFVPKIDAPEFGLPVMVTTLDAAGQQVEYYVYDRINFNIGLADADFDPLCLWR
ncbi:MAG: hypothetical protein C4297_09630 [Gemmataceae bacterium]